MNLAVFVSGRGSNLSALLEIVNVQTVVTSSLSAGAVFRAKRAGVEVLYAGLKKHVEAIDPQWEKLTFELERRSINAIFLAGFMRILPTGFVERWKGRLWNIHPSFLPAYPGLKSIERAFDDHVDGGATLHEVDAGVDTGRIVRQKRVRWGPTLSAMKRRTHIAEHRLVREVTLCKYQSSRL